MNLFLRRSDSDDENSATDMEGDGDSEPPPVHICHCDDNSPIVSSSMAVGTVDEGTNVVSIVPYSSLPSVDTQDKQEEYVLSLIFILTSKKLHECLPW